MQCKNCNTTLRESAAYCQECGAKVINQRLTAKILWQNIADQVFGWDNKYLLTIKTLLLKPELVLSSYINGTRKRYMAPFALLAINTAISTIIFNLFSSDYMEMIDTINQAQFDVIENSLNGESQIEYHNHRLDQTDSIRAHQSFIVKYLNIVTFMLIPLFGFITFLVFRKPYNYGEHMVITTYIQSFLSIVSLILFVSSLWINPVLFSLSIICSIIYYTYAYGRLYKLGAWQLFLRFLTFIGILLGLLLMLIVLGILYGITMSIQ